MQTFLILLTIIFVPFIWFIRRMLRFTDETVGDDSLVFGLENSPNRIRSYQFSDVNQFGSIDRLVNAFVLMAIVWFTFFLVVGVFVTPAYLLILLPFALLVSPLARQIAFFFYVSRKFQTLTYHTRVTFDPYTPSLLINQRHHTDTLTPHTLNRIEHHRIKTKRSRDPLHLYGFYCFHRTDSRAV